MSNITALKLDRDAHGFANACARIGNLFGESVGDMYRAQEGETSGAGMDADTARAILAARKGIRGRAPLEARIARHVLGMDAEVKLYPGESIGTGAVVSADDVARIGVERMSVLALARKAGTLARLVKRTGDPRAVAALDATAEDAALALARMFTVNADAFAQWNGNGHLSGIAAADRHNKATAWTTSLKGHDATGRDAEGVSHNKAHRSAVVASVRQVCERAILEALKGDDA